MPTGPSGRAAAGSSAGRAPGAVEDIAARLWRAGQERTAIAPVADQLPERTIECAYAVQEVNTRRAAAEGRRLVGRKIGLTAASVQKQLGVGEPDFGVLFADMEVEDGGWVAASALITPLVEAEMAFVLSRPIEREDMTLPELLRSIECVLPAIEIVDSRIADWKISIFDTIADNASAALYVLGTSAKRVSEVDLRLAGMVLERNGVAESFGSGAGCMGNPLNALRWLARVSARLGNPLQEGDIVLSGALGPMVKVRAGDAIAASISGLGAVRVMFTGANS